MVFAVCCESHGSYLRDRRGGRYEAIAGVLLNPHCVENILPVHILYEIVTPRTYFI